MTITASYSNNVLTIVANGDFETVGVSRNAGGALFVNRGAVPITGGVPTVGNTFEIDMSTSGRESLLGIDNNNGTMPVAHISGGPAHDNIGGGSGSDQLFGNDGSDSLFGDSGNDLLHGGNGSDFLVGGPGNDQVFGDAGNDEMSWVAGDGHDFLDGGAGNDTAEFDGDDNANAFSIRATDGEGVKVFVDGVDSDVFAENIAISGHGGNDEISADQVSAFFKLTLDGGDGNDFVTGGQGDDVIVGGDGDDTVFGEHGNDTISLDAGDDRALWVSGDGNDTVDGGDGADALTLHGINAAEHFEISANGTHARIAHDLDGAVLDLTGVEQILIDTDNGADTVTVNDLSGTGITTVVIDFKQLTAGGTDGAHTAIVNATSGDDTIVIRGASDELSVKGLAAVVNVFHAEQTDLMVVNGGNGNDSINASLVGTSAMALTLDGGAGNDVIIGGDGNDRLVGNAGNDTLIGGAGDDSVFWGPGHGSDIIDGGEGNDFLAVRGSDTGEHFVLSANGTHVQIARDIDSTVLDVSQVESIELAVRSGADAVTVNNLGGTGVGEVDINLGLAPGVNVGDGSPDTVTLHGSDGSDSIIVQADSATISVAGLAAQFTIFNGDAEDTLVVRGDDGNDVIDATHVTTPVMALTLDGGAGNDVITGSAGDDILIGGAGEDTAVFNVDFDSVHVSYVGNKIFVDSAQGHDEVTGIENLQFTDGTIHRNDGNPLVDDLFYYANNKDVWDAGVDADDHYNTYGWQEGRDPNAEFSTKGYLSANADVRAAHINPLLHFDQFGWLEGRDPSANFDTQLYLQKNPDVAAAHADPLEHFEAFGRDEGRPTFAAIGSVIKNGFDAEYYLLVNPDVGFAGVDPYQHYATYGWQEGRNPNAFFDTKGYLAANPDVAAAHINPLEHYMSYGASEGRNASADFDTTGYLAAFHDVAAAGVNPLQHFLQNGIFEGRGDIFA